MALVPLPTTKSLAMKYTNGEIEVKWELKKCIHSAHCVSNLSNVFQPKERPWVKIDAASSDEIEKIVNGCLRGKLKFDYPLYLT
ncbi:MAG: (4Fe-4S)-binding protein [Flavobacteriales bacterium]|nr:(4Fe-4S)-binding protein [Flavobacteriales bacterium]